MNRRWMMALLLCLAVALTACGGGKQAAVKDSDQSAFTWQIELRGHEVKDKLHTDEGVPQYEGDVLDVAHDNAPSEGNVFLILTMTITKSKTGGGAFDWGKLSVVDADGSRYGRMDNDSFLSVHTYNRLPGTALQIGENKGSICLEIPEKASKGSLRLEYDAGEEGTNTITIQ